MLCINHSFYLKTIFVDFFPFNLGHSNSPIAHQPITGCWRICQSRCMSLHDKSQISNLLSGQKFKVRITLKIRKNLHLKPDLGHHNFASTRLIIIKNVCWLLRSLKASVRSFKKIRNVLFGVAQRYKIRRIAKVMIWTHL